MSHAATIDRGPATERRELFIGGQWRPAASGNTYPVFNPATGETLARVAHGDAADTRAAIEAAEAAFPAWSRVPALERGRLLRAAAALMRERAEALGRQLTLEQGKPLPEAIGEIEYAASFLDWFAGEGERLYGDIVPTAVAGRRYMVLKQPVGVIAAITPWNFPAAMITRKLGPALAAGCTAVVKPAEQTPLTAISMMEIFEEVGVPAGVVNLITTSTARVVGQELIDNPIVRKITFTGSTEVGKLIMRGAADRVKRVSLELGGHAPVIVFDDADLDVAVAGTIASKFRNMGQTCVCANRIYVHKDVIDEFAWKLTEAIAEMPIGNGLEQGVRIGPLIDKQGLEKVRHHVDDAVTKGARVLLGGNVCTSPDLQGGQYFEPTVLVDVDESMQIMQEETFGPVAPLIPFESEEEVYRRANASVYGLAAYVFTENINRAIRAAERLEYGIVGVNEGLVSTAQVPFGGMKESGIGREGGAYGIHEFVDVKMVALGIKEDPVN